MCDEIADLEWTPLGVVRWQGEVVAIEFCARCATYRGRMLDVNEIEVVTGPPSVASEQAGGASEPAGDVDVESGGIDHPDDEAPSGASQERDDGDDWLVR